VCVWGVCVCVRDKVDEIQCGCYHCEASVGEVKVSSDKAVVRLAQQQSQSRVEGNRDGKSGGVVQMARGIAYHLLCVL